MDDNRVRLQETNERTSEEEKRDPELVRAHAYTLNDVNDDNAGSSEPGEPAATDMFNPKDIPPPQGMPERWARLLHKAHEVGNRVADAIRHTIEQGENRSESGAGDNGGSDSGAASYRSIGPADM